MFFPFFHFKVELAVSTASVLEFDNRKKKLIFFFSLKMNFDDIMYKK